MEKYVFLVAVEAAEKQGQLMSEGDVAVDNLDAVGGIMAMGACKQVVRRASRRRSWANTMHKIHREELRKKGK